MSEQDHFEQQLRAALDRYVAGGPTGFDAHAFARMVATTEPRRRGWPVVLLRGWRATTVPTVAWVVLLAALLLATAVSLYVGSQLIRTDELGIVPVPSAEPVASLVPEALPTAASPPDQGTATMSLGSEISDLAIAPDGGIWAATGRGVLHWDPGAATATIHGPADGVPDSAVVGVVAAPDGVVWARGYRWLARFDGSWTVYDEPAELGGLEGVEIGAMATDASGRLWVAAGVGGGMFSKLLRFDDGGLSVIDVPESIAPLGGSFAFELSVAPNGDVWATRGAGGLAVYDGAEWTLHDRSTGGLPQTPWLAAPAPDGTVWTELGGEGCTDTVMGGVVCDQPPAGLARWDGARWTVYTTDDGLAANEGMPYVGLDGSVWAVHLEGSVSRWDGTRWVASQSGRVAGAAWAATVAPDGALWSWSPTGGVARFDGAQAAPVVVPPVGIAVAQPALSFPPVAEPEVTRTAVGDITWRVFRTPEYGLLDLRATAHGLVGVDGRSGLRWSTDGETWQGIALSIAEARWLAVDGDDVIAFGSGAARASWDGRQWVETERLETRLPFVEQVVFGPRGAVLTSRTKVLVSTDGRRFERAERPPDYERLEAEWTDRGGFVGGCTPNGHGEGPGEGRVGPVVVTAEGFVAMTAGHPADWNSDPMCEPVLWSSADGSRWELVSRESPFGDGAWVTGVASYDGRHVAVGGQHGAGAVWVSDDGLAWVRLDLPLGEAVSVAGGPAGWILLEAGWDPASQGRVSSDGLTWEQVPSGWPGVSLFIAPPLTVGPDSVASVGRWNRAGTDEWISAVVIGTVGR
jgi:hypothetical protein